MAVKTLQEAISFTNRFDVKKLALYSTDIYGITTITTTLFDKYFDLIEQYIYSYSVNQSQKDNFKYRPDVLSMAIYKTHNLDWLIMKINNIESSSRFILRDNIKLIPSESLDALFTELKNKSTDFLANNRAENNIT